MSTSMKEEGLEEEEQTVPQRTLKRHDSLDIESRKFAGHSNGRNADNKSWSVILILAFQSIGIVYGDIGTSPTYVYQSAFYNGIRHKDDVYGVLGIILYTITLLPLVKYVLIVLRATDNGEGNLPTSLNHYFFLPFFLFNFFLIFFLPFLFVCLLVLNINLLFFSISFYSLFRVPH